MLGWGEITFTRYFNGKEEPAGKYLEALQRIYIEPDYFMLILERNKNNITSVTYKKSKDATQKLLTEKVKDIDYFNRIVENITNELIDELSGFNFSAKCVNSILSKINNTVENSKIQIESA